MTPDEWKRIETAFQRAIELDNASRKSFLQQLDSEDPAVHTVVQRMLEEDEVPGDVLTEPVATAAESFASTVTDRWAGQSFGNFRAVRKLASGGMSAVYLGRRDDDQYDQDVAIKIVAGSFQSDELNTRFKTERQILASLRHPYIAQLHDGGTTADGTPYLVMEYVDGLPIDEYCNRNRLHINDRLELFGKVCAAVDFAHRNLIVHRDIKPSNILVSEDGTPKLLDFGIAKPLEQALFSQTIAQTRDYARAMTPEFASPEQVRGETITTSTDVYSLGVLLYKILSGRMPYATTGSNVAALAEAICETEPSRPSTVITQVDGDSEAAEKIVTDRATSVGKLRKLLAGDLDNIVMVTLQKDPARRYASARELFDDIERYLAKKPVEARADTLFYRSRRFVQRNKLGVAATALILALLIGFPSFYSVQVAKQRDRAELEAAKSASVADFMQSLFDSSNPSVAQGESVSARALLDEGAERIRVELDGQPDVRAAMQTVMGNAYYGLGLYDQARPLLDAALATRMRLFGRDHPEVLETQSSLAALTAASGDYAEAERQRREALAISRAVHGEQSVETAGIYAALGSAIHEQGRLEDARAEFERALAIHEALSSDASFEKATTLRRFGWLLTNLGEYDVAETYLEDSVAMLRDTVGERHPEMQATLNQLAYAQMDTGQWDAAERTMREGLDLSVQIYGEEHPEVSGNLATLATVLQRKGELEEAERLFRQTLAIDGRMLGDEHPYIAMDKNNLAAVLEDQGKFEEAQRLFRESLQLNRQLHGAEHPETLTSTSNLGLLFARAGNFSEAQDYITTALEGRTQVLGADHPATLISRNILAVHLHRMGDFVAAKALFEDIRAERRRVLGEEHPAFALTLLNHGELLRDMGQAEAARDEAELAHAIYTKVHGESHATVARTLQLLATIAAATDDAELARESFERSLRQYREYFPAGHPQLATALTAYGEWLVLINEAEQALPLLEEALSIRQEKLPAGHWQTGVTQSVLGSCRSVLGLPDAASDLQAGLDTLSGRRGADDWLTQRAADRLAAHRERM